MATNAEEGRRTLDDEQKIDARHCLGMGARVADVAKAFGLTELELRRELGLPQWQTLPTDRQRTLFDAGGGQ